MEKLSFYDVKTKGKFETINTRLKKRVGVFLQ